MKVYARYMHDRFHKCADENAMTQFSSLFELRGKIGDFKPKLSCTYVYYTLQTRNTCIHL